VDRVVTRRDESFEEWVRLIRFAEEFRMILAGDEEGMIFEFDDFDEFSVRARAAEEEPGFFELCTVFVIEFVTVTVAFVDDKGAVELRGF